MTAVEVAHVPLPALNEFLLHQTQAGGPIWGDSRRFPRFAADVEARLESDGTYACSGFASTSQGVLLRDISRGGVRFVHGAEIFPGERFELRLPNGREMHVEASWCRRVAAGVYVTGCRFCSVRESKGEPEPA
jgi:hypothetical protein